MTELEIVLSNLHGVKKIAGGYQAICPCHDDKHQSLSVKDDNGKLLLYCHAGCSFESIIKALNLPPKRNNRAKLNDTPIITYDYTDKEGNLLYQVVRYYPKGFKQRRLVNDEWVWNLNGIQPTLYHLPEVLEAIKEDKLIFIVEGEKDADNLRKSGQVATSISGGISTKWAPSLVPLFQDARVIIIPDKDAPGQKYAYYVANLLYGWCALLKVITLPDKDVSDYLQIKTLDELFNIIYNTSGYIPTGVVSREEFNSWRGINQYLWQLLIKHKKKNYQYDKIILDEVLLSKDE